MGRRLLALMAAFVMLTTACEGVFRYQLDVVRGFGQVAPVDTRGEAYLQQQADARAQQRCDGPLTQAPEIAYGGESFGAVAELDGLAPLDETILDDDRREYEATMAIWADWGVDPTVVDDALRAGAVATTVCPDGQLAAVMVLRQPIDAVPEAPYGAPVFEDDQLTETNDVVYQSVIDHTGTVVELALDVIAPPPGENARPAVALFHGGGYTSGDRSNRTNDARAYARHGFVAVTVSYRLRSRPVDVEAAQADAIDDGRAAIAWIRDNAAELGVDTDRIAAVGTSSGGEVALGLAASASPADTDTTDTRVAAAVSTGADVTATLSALDIDGDEAPVLAFRHELDRDGWEDAHRTCAAWQSAGSVCDWVLLPGTGHASSLSPDGPWWTREIGPFLWHHLELAGIDGPSRAEPFHVPTLTNASTLDPIVLEAWADRNGHRRTDIDIHVADGPAGDPVRVPVSLLAPADADADGLTVTLGAAGNRLTTRERQALAAGQAVVRVDPATISPAIDRVALDQRFRETLDTRYTDVWLGAVVTMRAITAALADDAIEAGPVTVIGDDSAGIVPMVAAIHDDRITTVSVSDGPVRPVAGAPVDDQAAKVAELPAGRLPWTTLDGRVRDDLATDHVLAGVLAAVRDDYDPAVGWAELQRRGVRFHAGQAAVSASLPAPEVDTSLVGNRLRVTVTFPDGAEPDSGTVHWAYDRPDDGSWWSPGRLLDSGHQAVLELVGDRWRAVIETEPGHSHVDLITVHTDTNGAVAPLAVPFTRVELPTA